MVSQTSQTPKAKTKISNPYSRTATNTRSSELRRWQKSKAHKPAPTPAPQLAEQLTESEINTLTKTEKNKIRKETYKANKKEKRASKIEELQGRKAGLEWEIEQAKRESKRILDNVEMSAYVFGGIEKAMGKIDVLKGDQDMMKKEISHIEAELKSMGVKPIKPE